MYFKFVKKSATKSCSLDSIPTWLVKSNIDIFLSAITKIINTSLQSGQFPGKFKEAIITPLLKKRTLDNMLLK